MIKVVVCGACGQMGKRIIKTVTSNTDMEIVGAIENPNSPDIGEDIGEIAGIGRLGVNVTGSDALDGKLSEIKPDVLVDFTTANAAVENIRISAENNVPVVVGTTGFSNKQRSELESAIRENKIPAIITPNMSVGVNVFFKLAEEAAEYLDGYDIELIETHHNKKIDAPSGTALRIAEIVANATDRDLDEVAKYGRPKGEIGERESDEIGIHAIRAGNVAGEHVLIFAGSSERIEITHKAQSKQVFVGGVIKAIRYIMREGKNGEIQDMQDVLRLT